MKIEYTKALNLTSYSDSMQVVAYDDVKNRLLVSWQSNPKKIYSYFGLPGVFDDIAVRVRDGESPRAVIKEHTDNLQRETVFENAEFWARPQEKLAVMPSTPKKDKFVVRVSVDGFYEIEIDALDVVDAAQTAKELFSQHFNGEVYVGGVNKA